MILDKIVKKKKYRIEKAKTKQSQEEVKEKAESKIDSIKIDSKRKKLLKNNKEHEILVIAEVKKASPSKGKFYCHFSVPELVRAYEKGGADLISVVTEEDFFMGGKELFEEVFNSTSLPILRKDFIIDPYQIYESKIMGASLLLLICSILDEKRLKEFIDLSLKLNILPLVEVHTREELFRALKAEAMVIGINNRDLKEFKTSLDNTKAMLPLIPKDKIVISESGIDSAEDVIELKKIAGKCNNKQLTHASVDGVLVGEALVKSKNPAKKIEELKSERSN